MSEIEKAMQGDVLALSVCLQAESVYLVRTASLYLHNPADIQEAIADTTLAALHGIRQLRDAKMFRTWLTRILIRQCYKRYAQATHEVLTVADLPEAVVTQALSVEQKLDMLAALRRLNDANRQVLLMYYYHDLSVAEIAEITGTSANTVKSQLRRGKLQLRAWLGGDYFEG